MTPNERRMWIAIVAMFVLMLLVLTIRTRWWWFLWL